MTSISYSQWLTRVKNALPNIWQTQKNTVSAKEPAPATTRIGKTPVCECEEPDYCWAGIWEWCGKCGGKT